MDIIWMHVVYLTIYESVIHCTFCYETIFIVSIDIDEFYEVLLYLAKNNILSLRKKRTNYELRYYEKRINILDRLKSRNQTRIK